MSDHEVEQLIAQQFVQGCKAVHARITVGPDGQAILPAHRFAAFMLPGEPTLYIGIRPANATEWLIWPFTIHVVFMTLGNMLVNLTAGVQQLAALYDQLKQQKPGKGGGKRGQIN